MPEEGEMAERIRALDWQGTPLGEPQTWSATLRTALSLCLSSRFPVLLWFGKDFRILYNDAYIPFLGPAKHPMALGQAGEQCWREIWPSIGPMLESVYRTRQATWTHDGQYFFDRALPREEVYVTFTYAPIFSADGSTVEGVFCPCTETTHQVINARRWETLRKLGMRSLETRNMAAACQHISQTLDENRLDVPFAAIYERSDDATFTLLASTGLSEPAHLASSTWPLAQASRTGQAIDVNLTAAGLKLPGGAWPEPADGARVVPVRWAADGAVSGVIVLGVSPRRPLDDEYTRFLDLVALHTGTSIANVLAYEQESRRAQALADLDRAKTDFFSNVSHEFRTPLTLILGPVQAMLADPVNPPARDQLAMVERNALRLQKLVNQLLDFSRLEADRHAASFVATPLDTLTRELTAVFESAIEKAGLRLSVSCDPLDAPLYVDRDMYEKILMNLLSNALKFTHAGEIAVRLRDAGSHVTLSVRDTGVGIDAAELPNLFKRFHRIADAHGRTREGTGIGLALVHALVELHAGHTQVSSTLGEGSEFTVTLRKGTAHLPSDRLGAPSDLTSTALGAEHFLEESLRWAPDETAATPRPTDASAAAPRARILWADDNADMRTYVARLLAPAYEVETVPDGQAALASAQHDPPALVLTDIMMPGLDGFALLRALREDARTRDVPVILISARAGEQARMDGMRAGADDYLVKPFSARELIACVDGHVRLAAARAEARHALSASEQRLRTVIDQLPTGVGVTDLQGRWLLANGLMERYVPKGVPSRTPERIARWQAWDADGNALAPSEWPSARALRGESVVPGLDARYLDDEGVEHWLRVSAAPWRDDDGTVMGACTVVQDVTQLKHAQQRLQDADRRKNEFLATLAHELRNPLAPISNGLFLLRQEGLEPAAADNVRDMLERQVRHLVRLVDDLMEISRIAGGKITLRKQSVDVDSLLRNAIETSRPLIDANAHRLTVSLPDAPLYLRADPVRLTQVFANLLNNAAKYTDPGGSIDVSARRERGQVVVRVRDNGVGITAEMLPRLFDLFTQVDPLNERAQGGLGIGLTLVRNLVERHQGSVQAYSDGPGSGSEFVVRLPLDRAPAQPAATPAPVPDAARRLGKIMVVDDHPDVGDSMAAILSALGAQVRVCRSGPDALAALQGFHPRVMLLDIGMPGMDGYELAQRVRAQPHLQDITLVVLSGWGQQADMARSRAVGIEHHLVKPVDPVELERLLARICTQEAPNAPGQAASAKGQPSHDTPAG
nr:ATP-binding protein [Verticiella sp. GG226]